ncbi:hypothetical protein Patl1_22511 [Pistacia atlantica]|uniref:Uncharacterized protein n=1 Tax=Pistacia atlantica TaxID=434234 RepID=A0ACC0ZY69_9ROSI|nr:hypothetical protein Patl1_22511 [Pistacia atlantica]
MCHVTRKLFLTIGFHPAVIELGGHEISALPPTSSHDKDDSLRNPAAPAVFIGGTCVGGLESLVALHLSGHLVPELVEVGALWDFSYLDKNLEDNASGETGVLYGRARNWNLGFRSRSKQVIDHEDAEQGKLQSAVPLDLSVSEDVSIWSKLWRVVKGYHDESLNVVASVFPLVYSTILVVCFGFKKEPFKKEPSQDYHKPSDPDDLRVQIGEDHRESFVSDLGRSPDDLASRVSEMDCYILRHDQPQDIQEGDEDEGEDEDEDLRGSCSDKNLEENASGETRVLYGRAKNQNLRFRSRSKQVIDHEDAEQGKLQSAVPLDLSVSEDVSIRSTLWRVVKGYLFMTLIGMIKTSKAFTMSSINRRSDLLEMYLFLFVHLLVLYSCLFLVPENKELIIEASVLRIVCYTTLVVLLSFKKEPSREPSEPNDLRVQIDEDHHECFQSDFRRSPDDLASRVSKMIRHILRHDQPQDIQGDDEDNKHSLVLYLYHKYKKLALAILFFILEIISSVLELISSVLDITGKGKLVFIGAALVLAVFDFFATLLVYWKGRSIRLPDEKPILNLELLISGTQLFTTLLHLILLLKGDDKYYIPLVPLAFAGFRAFSAFRKKHENVFHNAAEPPAENQVNQHENGFHNAAEPPAENQVNQHENCIPNAAEPPAENQVNQHENGIPYAAEPPAENQVNQHENGITNASELPAENQVNQHENGIHNVAEPPAENQVNQHENGIHNEAEPPAESQANQHENGIHNAAEPPAENQVNQGDGSRNIMVHMTVTGKHLNMVIDLTMVTCYEQLFRKLRDEMFQAVKELWGDRPRWDVLYLDISNEAHYLREDKIPWGEFCMAARKVCIRQKEVCKQLDRRWESMPRTSEKGLERALFT